MTKAIVFFCLTAVCWLLAIVFGVRFVTSIAESTNSSLAELEAPGSVTFRVKEAGTVSLWHNYQDFRGGKSVLNDSALPSGFSFEMKEVGSSAVLPFASSGANTNFSSGSTSKSGLGTFELPAPGEYELTATAPAGETRLVSLSEGTLLEGFTKIFGHIGLAMVFGLVGLITLILAVVFLITKPKPKPPLPAHAS